MRVHSAESSRPWKRLVAELATIIAGVLIALAVNAWWERRQERNEAEQYMRQLLVDFQVNQRRLQGTIQAETQRLELVNRVLDRTFHRAYPSADSLATPTGYNQFDPLTGTVAALLQTGDLRLLPNDSLRFELIAFSALVDEVNTSLHHTETLIWNSTERVIEGRARHSQSSARRGANGGRGWGEIDVVGALNDPEIVSALQVQVVATQVRLFNLRRLEKPIARIIRLLGTEVRT